MPTISRRNFLKITAIAGGALAAPAVASGVLSRGTVTLTDTRTLMGTIIHLTVVTPDEAQGRKALSATFDEMARLAAVFDHRRSASPLAVLNRTGKLPQAPIELLDVMREAIRYGDLTGGAFDVTVKPVLDAYLSGRAPSAAQRARVDYRRVRVEGDCLTLDVPGAAVTLDGIAKGRVVDGGVAALRAKGFEDIMVEAGGDLLAHGHRADGQPWQVGVSHPRPERMSGYIAAFSLSSRAAATSGDYLNAFSADRRLHHIIDPRTGVSPPALSSVTVVAPTATAADALSTALMVLGPDDGLALANRLPDVEALIVTKDVIVRRTGGFPA